MLDCDLAALYGTETKRLNEQVKRNLNRFPPDFMFQLSEDEKNEVVAFCDHLANIKYSRTNPYAFTEHGTIMAASILNTPFAVQTSVLIVRAFIKLREIIATNQALLAKIEEVEAKYDNQFNTVFRILKELMQREVALKERVKIVFRIRNGEADQ